MADESQQYQIDYETAYNASVSRNAFLLDAGNQRQKQMYSQFRAYQEFMGNNLPPRQPEPVQVQTQQPPPQPTTSPPNLLEMHGYSPPSILNTLPSSSSYRPSPYAPSPPVQRQTQQSPIVPSTPTPTTQPTNTITSQIEAATPYYFQNKPAPYKPSPMKGGSFPTFGTPPPQTYPQAFTKSIQNVADFKTIKDEGIGAYWSNIWTTPYEYVGKTKRESVIGYNMNAPYRGTMSSGGVYQKQFDVLAGDKGSGIASYSGASYDTTNMTYGELVSRRELEANVPLKYIGVSGYDVMKGEAVRAQSKYQGLFEEDSKKINEFYQKKVDSGEGFLIPTQMGYQLDPNTQMLYDLEINKSRADREKQMVKSYEISSQNIIGQKERIESGLLSDVDKVMGFNLDTKSGYKVGKILPSVAEAGIITAATATGVTPIVLATGAYVTASGTNTVLHSAFDKDLTLGQRAVGIALGGVGMYMGAKITSYGGKLLARDVNTYRVNKLIEAQSKDPNFYKIRTTKEIGTNRFTDYMYSKVTQGKSSIRTSAIFNGKNLGKVNIRQGLQETKIVYQDFSTGKYETIVDRVSIPKATDQPYIRKGMKTKDIPIKVVGGNKKVTVEVVGKLKPKPFIGKALMKTSNGKIRFKEYGGLIEKVDKSTRISNSGGMKTLKIPRKQIGKTLNVMDTAEIKVYSKSEILRSIKNPRSYVQEITKVPPSHYSKVKITKLKGLGSGGKLDKSFDFDKFDFGKTFGGTSGGSGASSGSISVSGLSSRGQVTDGVSLFDLMEEQALKSKSKSIVGGLVSDNYDSATSKALQGFKVSPKIYPAPAGVTLSPPVSSDVYSNKDRLRPYSTNFFGEVTWTKPRQIIAPVDVVTPAQGSGLGEVQGSSLSLITPQLTQVIPRNPNPPFTPRPNIPFSPRYPTGGGGGGFLFPPRGLRLSDGISGTPRRKRQVYRYTPSLTGSILGLKGRSFRINNTYVPFGRGIGGGTGYWESKIRRRRGRPRMTSLTHRTRNRLFHKSL